MNSLRKAPPSTMTARSSSINTTAFLRRSRRWKVASSSQTTLAPLLTSSHNSYSSSLLWSCHSRARKPRQLPSWPSRAAAIAWWTHLRNSKHRLTTTNLHRVAGLPCTNSTKKSWTARNDAGSTITPTTQRQQIIYRRSPCQPASPRPLSPWIACSLHRIITCYHSNLAAIVSEGVCQIMGTLTLRERI